MSKESLDVPYYEGSIVEMNAVLSIFILIS